MLVEMALAEKSLTHFVEQAWHVVEPKTPYAPGWHIEVVCEHLEAVTTGDIKRLIINIPPRHMKSLAVCVFWPCWEWGPLGTPHIRWLFSSYAEQLSKRDSLKCRRLIQSDWYQQRWGGRFLITSDQNEKMRFENDKTGYRVATSVGGLGTGEGGDRICVDDPHNVKEGESELKRGAVLTWWDETMSTRVNDPSTSAKVIIMQRVHEADLCGHILEAERGYVHLCLPARYEGENRIKTCLPLDGPPYEDPREDEGEPLWEELYGDEALAGLEEEMTEYARAGQLQQRPHPRGGGMFKIEQIDIVDAVPVSVLGRVRYWDKAGTEGGGAQSAGVKMSQLPNGTYLVEDSKTGHWSSWKREKHIVQAAEMDGKAVTVWLEQEPGSAGKESAEASIKRLAGFRAYADRVTGSKEARAEPFAAQVEAGNVSLLRGDWNQHFLDEYEKFPVGKYKDQVDAGSGAFSKLVAKKKQVGIF